MDFMRKNKIKKNEYLKKTFLSLGFLIVVLSSLVYLYETRDKITKKLNLIFSKTNKSDVYKSDIDHQAELDEKNYEWSQKIMKGGYILHFRHAEREKWIDVVMYDLLDSHIHNKGKDQTRFPENDYFSKAVCLNERGIVQAKAMAEFVNSINIPIGYIISSTSCRSRQTADIVFGGYNEIKTILVHKGPYKENEKKRVKRLKNLYLSLPIIKGKNTIVSAHNSVVDKGMFKNVIEDELFLEEGGFYVISKKSGKLHLEHKFFTFSQFSKNFYER